jgi:hypothetical protein
MNAYIEILKFGCRFNAISFSALFEHLTDRNITLGSDEKLTESNYLLLNIFRTSFQDTDGKAPGNNVFQGVFFLKTEALAYLMSYESLELAKADTRAARAEALKASRQSTYAIIIAVISLIVSTFISVHYR